MTVVSASLPTTPALWGPYCQSRSVPPSPASSPAPAHPLSTCTGVTTAPLPAPSLAATIGWGHYAPIHRRSAGVAGVAAGKAASA